MQRGVYNIVLCAMLTAILVVSKEMLSFLANVELVSLLIIVYTICLPKQTIYVVLTFVLVQGLLYGFGTWWFAYLYTWPLLYFLTKLLSKFQSPLVFIALSTIFGLSFGALCALVYIPISGVQVAFAWFIAGLPFDLIHAVANLFVAAVLFVPVRKALMTIAKNAHFNKAPNVS